MDPCEAAFDRPLLYESGWGKALSYVFAIGTSGFVDVIRRYTRKKAEVQSRRVIVPEADLASKLSALNTRIRKGLPQDLINLLVVRDLAEQLVRYGKRLTVFVYDNLFRYMSTDHVGLDQLSLAYHSAPSLIILQPYPTFPGPGAIRVQLLRWPDTRGALHPLREDYWRS